MSKAIYLTGAAANVMMDIWAASQKVPAGVPVPVTNAAGASELERAGMIESHHLGKGFGAVVTPKGAAFVKDAIKHFNN